MSPPDTRALDACAPATHATCPRYPATASRSAQFHTTAELAGPPRLRRGNKDMQGKVLSGLTHVLVR